MSSIKNNSRWCGQYQGDSTKPTIKKAEDAFSYLKEDPATKARTETFRVILLDKDRTAFRKVNCAKGGRKSVRFRIDDVLGPALKYGAERIILVHNHPNGILLPSSEDMELTNYLVPLLESNGISVEDHIIISKKGYFSLRENKMMPKITNRKVFLIKK